MKEKYYTETWKWKRVICQSKRVKLLRLYCMWWVDLPIVFQSVDSIVEAQKSRKVTRFSNYLSLSHWNFQSKEVVTKMDLKIKLVFFCIAAFFISW